MKKEKSFDPLKCLSIREVRLLRKKQATIPAGSGFSPGFSLIELVVILAIAGIVAAIAIPGFQVMNASAYCKGAAKTLSTDLAFAKMRAISQGKRIRILFVNAQSYKFQVDNGSWLDMTGEPARDLTAGSSPYYSKDVSFSYAAMSNPPSSAGGKDVVFTTSGTCESCGTGSISITVQNTGNSRKVSVYPTGKIEEIKL